MKLALKFFSNYFFTFSGPDIDSLMYDKSFGELNSLSANPTK